MVGGAGILALRAMLGTGDRGGLAQPIGGAANADGMGGGIGPDGRPVMVDGSPEASAPFPEYAESMSASDRIRAMQQMNNFRATSNGMTAQNWRY
jgi:hypothetical protein